MSQQTPLSPGQPTHWRKLTWLLALIPLILLGVISTLIVVTGGGLADLAMAPVEKITIQRITLPEPGKIVVEVINDGPQTVTIPQVMVDEAYWQFNAEPSTTIPRFGRTVFTIPYPWVENEAHEIALITEIGTTFSAEIPIASQTPSPSIDLFARFGLVGFYVGIVPVFLGMLWYPFIRRLGAQGLNFILSLTIGLLTFLAVGTWLDAQEFAEGLPLFWQGLPMIIYITLITLGALIAIASLRHSHENTVLGTAYRIALGIGLHNLGEGLAIGAAFALGEAALGTFLILGFTIHNITEGIGIVAPIARKNPGLRHFAMLLLLAGGPAILGVWLGGFAFNPILATIFLAIGIGAILQVIWEVGKLVMQDNARRQQSLINWVNLSGVVVGLAIMYFTAFLVKF